MFEIKKAPQMQGIGDRSVIDMGFGSPHKVYLGRGLNWQGAVPQTQPPASR
jgi:hypothetical protein